MEDSHDYSLCYSLDNEDDILAIERDLYRADVRDFLKQAGTIVNTLAGTPTLMLIGESLKLRKAALEEKPQPQVELPVNIEIGAATSETIKNHLNEDAFSHTTTSAVVCDGVGSRGNGEKASKLASTAIISRLAEVSTQTSAKQAKVVMRNILEESDDLMVREQVFTGEEMASTVATGAVVKTKNKVKVVFGGLGDAQIYRLRNGKLKLLNNKKIPAKPSQRPALGKPNRKPYYIYSEEFKEGTTYLLTSNGIRKNVSLKKIGKLARTASRKVDAEQVAGYFNGNATGIKSRDACTTVVMKYSSKSKDLLCG